MFSNQIKYNNNNSNNNNNKFIFPLLIIIIIIINIKIYRKKLLTERNLPEERGGVQHRK